MLKALPRTTRKATSANRREHDALKMDILEKSFCASDDIHGLTLAEIQSAMQAGMAIPEGYLLYDVHVQQIVSLFAECH